MAKVGNGLFVEERKEKIMEMVRQNNKIAVPELCTLFGVSPSTIRNDLRELSDAGLIKRTYGGAIAPSKTSFEPLPIHKEVVMQREKSLIAAAAADLVEDGDTIAIDTGTTAYEFAKLLVRKNDLTVVVNDLNIAKYLADNTEFNLVFMGGLIRKRYHYTYGGLNQDSMNLFNVDKAFMTCNGVTVERGITTPDVISASIKQQWIRQTPESILLCDSSKIGNITFVQVVPLEKITTIVTDGGADPEELEKISSCGVQVIVAPLT